MQSLSAATALNEQLGNAEEPGYVHVSTPSGSEQDVSQPHHRRPPKHVREVSRRMQALQEGLHNLSIQQNVMNARMMQYVTQEKFWDLVGKVESLMCTLGVVQQLQSDVAMKVDVDQVPSKSAFKELTAIVGTKADADQCPLLEAFQQLRDEVVAKADVSQVPTNEAFEQLQQNVATKADLHQVRENIQQVMQTKADVDQVPTNKAFEQFRYDLATKATADQVPTNAAFEKLQKDVLTKAIADQVPTNDIFEKLQNDVAMKALARQVPTNEAFQQLKIIVESKADANQVPTVEDLRELRNEVTALDVNQVHTNEVFKQLWEEVATKAATSNTPTNETLRQLLQTKADADQVPTNEAFDRFRNDVTSKARGDHIHADLVSLQEDISYLEAMQNHKHASIMHKFENDVLSIEAFRELEIRLMTKERCVFTVSSNGAKGNSGRIIWNMSTKHPPFQNSGVMFANTFDIETDGEHVLIPHSGVYKVEAQILPRKGHTVMPFIEVDNQSAMYGYGGTDIGSGYSAANMSALLELTAGAKISVNFQESRARVYKNPAGVTHNRHNLVITRVS